MLMLTQTPAASMPGQAQPLSQTAARDASQKAGGSKIRGRVTAADTGRPIRRATIRVTLVDGLLPGGPATVTTDNEGRYEIGNLPGGAFTLAASSAGYVPWIHGQRRAEEPGKPIEVGENATVERINFALQRGGVITGAVVDEFGDWLVNSTVRAMRVEFLKGKRELVPAGSSATTNDIGEFRIFGLATGAYYVSVISRVAFGQVGQADSAYPPTYYPGTPNVGEAQPVKVAAGQTANISIAMSSSRAARLSGAALDADGQPMRNAFLNLTSRTGGAGLGVSAGQVQADGSFVLSGVPPGDYQLRVDSTTRPADGVLQSALTTIIVSGDDISDIRLMATRWVTGAGRIVVEPELRASFKLSALRVGSQRTARDDPFTGFGGGGPVREDATFDFSAPAGAVTLTVTGMPAGWRVKAVRQNSLDITDAGFDLPAGDTVEGIEVELTNRGPHLSGRVTNARGEAVKQFTAVVFSQDRDQRQWNSRYLATARPNNDGQFSVASLPPGDYYAVALESLATGQGSDPEFLRELEDLAIKFSVAERETKALELKLSFP